MTSPPPPSSRPAMPCPHRATCFISHCAAPRQLYPPAPHDRLSRRPPHLRRPRTARRPPQARAATAALDKESEENRYVDLRTLKTVRWADAHIAPGAAPGCRFGPFEHPCEDAHVDIPPDLLFSHETLPLTQGQRDVVRTLLSRRSVLFHSAAAEATLPVVVDLALRARVWRQTVLYCAPSKRAAEAVHAALAAQLAAAPDGAVVLDVGDVNSRPSLAHVRAIAKRAPRARNGGRADAAAADGENAPVPSAIVTVPAVLRRQLVSPETSSWMKFVDVAVLDNLFVDENSMWEELLLGMPNRVAICLAVKDISVSSREQLLLWFETVHNNVVPVLPPGTTSVLDRIERCVDLPVLRAFVYNAALHSAPVQVSLPLLRDVALQELMQTSAESDVDYSSALLHGVTVMEAIKPEDLLFRSSHEAEYADFVSILLHDSKRTEKNVRAKSRKRAAVKKRNRTASSISAARKRRNGFYSDSLVFPAIMLVPGRLEAVSAANALISAADDETKLLWDAGSRDHLQDIVDQFMEKHENDLDDEACELISMLLKGIGVIQTGMLPAVRLLTEELFWAGFIPALFVDTHLGPAELVSLPSAKTIIVQSSAFAEIDDPRKGLVKGATVASIAGRTGKDDVGNVIVMWYDEAVDDAEAAAEIAAGLLLPVLSENRRTRKRNGFPDVPTTNRPDLDDIAFLGKLLGPHRVQRSNDVLWSSYAGVLRSLRSFGLDGYKAVLEYTTDSYQGWLVGATLRATREKMQVEQKAVDERLNSVNWAEIALHDRRLAKHQECVRVLKAMKSHEPAVLAERVVSMLGCCDAGRIIGLRLRTNAIASGDVDDPLLPKNYESSFKNSANTGVAVAESEVKTLAKVGDAKESKSNDYIPAVFVAVLDRSTKKAKLCPIDANFVVICIMMDGVWTMVPSKDVVAEAADGVAHISDIDLLEVPHLATFDLDPVTGWAKCKPVTDSETLALERISDGLIGEVTKMGTAILKGINLPEYDKQKLRVGTSLRLLQETAWHGKEEELQEIRRLRRRAAKLNDDAAQFQETEMRLERVLNRIQENRRNAQRARLAVLEDCNAVRIHSDDEMEMTPIGALASILPGPYPLFSAACLLLVDGIEKLSPPELAAFVAVASGLDGAGKRQASSCTNGFKFSMSRLDAMMDNGAGDMVPIDRSSDRIPLQGTREVDDLKGVLPNEMLNVMEEILRALHMLQHRHTLGKAPMGEAPEPVALAEVAPAKLGLRAGRPTLCFARGDEWETVVSLRGLERGDAVQELRTVTEILSIIAGGGAIGEFGEVVCEKAQRAIGFMQRWPVCDTEDAQLLAESGIMFKEWNGQSYDRWWRANREQIRELVNSVDASNSIQSVEAEVIE